MMPLTRIQGYAHVAQRYGLEEAIFLDTIVHWWRVNRAENRNFRDGRWWTYNSMAAFAQTFPWWSAKQLRRIAQSCREQGAVCTGTYNENQRDRTIWYSPSDELLALYGGTETENCNCPNGQMQPPERAQPFAQMGQPLPCNNHVGTYIPPCSPPEGDGAVPNDLARGAAPEPQPTPAPSPTPKPRRTRRPKSVPDHNPERFEQFWTAYPGGGSRIKAVAAWDTLKPDDGLIDEMARALKRQMASRLWQEGVGIPHASTWLNQRRWTDKLPEQPRPRNTGGWAEDPEVMPDG